MGNSFAPFGKRFCMYHSSASRGWSVRSRSLSGSACGLKSEAKRGLRLISSCRAAASLRESRFSLRESRLVRANCLRGGEFFVALLRGFGSFELEVRANEITPLRQSMQIRLIEVRRRRIVL